MEIVFVLAIAAIAYLVWQARSSEHRQPAEPQFADEMGVNETHDADAIDVGPIVEVGERAWVINPKASFTLTITDADRGTVKQFRDLLDDHTPYGRHKELIALVARSNLRCREIDQYVAEWQPRFLTKIEELRAASSDWETASEKDREDLMIEFRQAALQSLDVVPYDYVEVLMEDEPPDATVDDVLIERYGFDTFQFYLRHARNLEKVRVIPADHRDRADFERLQDSGLARRGNEIPLEALADSLRLAELRNLVADASPPAFRRKAKAVEFLVSLADARERLGRTISFRERFQLLPLPPDLASIDLAAVSHAWAHAEAVAELVRHTFQMSCSDARDRAQYESFSKYEIDVTGWELMDAGESSCPHCRRAAARSYSANERPDTPLHIGCRCCVTPKLKGD